MIFITLSSPDIADKRCVIFIIHMPANSDTKLWMRPSLFLKANMKLIISGQGVFKQCGWKDVFRTLPTSDVIQNTHQSIGLCLSKMSFLISTVTPLLTGKPQLSIKTFRTEYEHFIEITVRLDGTGKEGETHFHEIFTISTLPLHTSQLLESPYGTNLQSYVKSTAEAKFQQELGHSNFVASFTMHAITRSDWQVCCVKYLHRLHKYIVSNQSNQVLWQMVGTTVTGKCHFLHSLPVEMLLFVKLLDQCKQTTKVEFCLEPLFFSR